MLTTTSRTSKVVLAAVLLSTISIGVALASANIGITTQQIQTGVPQTINLAGTASAEGTSLGVARADHVHGINTAQIYGTAHTWTARQTVAPPTNSTFAAFSVAVTGGADDGVNGPGNGLSATGGNAGASGDDPGIGLSGTGGDGQTGGVGVFGQGGKNFQVTPGTGVGGSFHGANGGTPGPFPGADGIVVTGGNPSAGGDTGFSGANGATITGGAGDGFNGAGFGVLGTGGSANGDAAGIGGIFNGGTPFSSGDTGGVGVEASATGAARGGFFVGGPGFSSSGAGTLGGVGVETLGGAGAVGGKFQGGSQGFASGFTSGAGLLATGGATGINLASAGGGTGGVFVGGTGSFVTNSTGTGIDVSTGLSTVATGTSTGWAINMNQRNTIKAHEHANLLTADPSSLTDGDRWYQGSGVAQTMKIRLNGGTGVVCTTGNTTTAGCQAVRGTAGCTTAASVGATCGTVVAWPNAFANTNYTVTCTGDLITSGVPLYGGITVKQVSSVTFQTVAATAAAAKFTTIECFAIHD